MSLWKTIRSDPSISSRINIYYASPPAQNGITLQVRDAFAQLIEDFICQLAFTGFPVPCDAADTQTIQEFLLQLTTEMDAWMITNININDNFAQQLRQAIPILKKLTTNDPRGIIQRIRGHIDFELSQFPNPQEIYSSMIRLKCIQSDLAMVSNRWSSSLNLMESDIEVSQFICDVSQIQSRFVDHLAIWKLQQQHLAIGILSKNNVLIDIGQIQPTAEQLFNFLCQIHKQLLEIQGIGSQFNIHHHVQLLMNLLAKLVRETFLVMDQPSWIVKNRETKVHMMVCQLIGQSLFQNANIKSQVKLSMINETQAKILNTHGPTILSQLENATKCTFDTRLKNFKFEPLTIRMVAAYNPVQLQKTIQRAQKGRGNESHLVMEEKFCFLFTTAFNILGNSVQCWTTSLPVTVSSHKNQNIYGQGIIVWDYATGGLNRVPFEVSISLPWNSVASILSSVFRKMLGLKPEDPGLNDDHLACLKQKAFSNLKPDEFYLFTQTDEMSFEELNRRKLGLDSSSSDGIGQKGFSFWDWFYMAIEFLKYKDHKEMWIKGLITGFISRSAAQELLSNEPEGTFILRFPDSVKEAISVTYVHQEGSPAQVANLQPYTLKRLELKSLANSMRGLSKIKYIFPSRLSKDQIFQEFYSTTPVLDEAYLPRFVAYG